MSSSIGCLPFGTFWFNEIGNTCAVKYQRVLFPYFNGEKIIRILLLWMEINFMKCGKKKVFYGNLFIFIIKCQILKNVKILNWHLESNMSDLRWFNIIFSFRCIHIRVLWFRCLHTSFSQNRIHPKNIHEHKKPHSIILITTAIIFTRKLITKQI